MQNTQIILAKRPERKINDQTFDIRKVETPHLRDGDIQVAVEYLSIDPAMRPWIHDVANYLPPVAIGAVMRGGAVGKIIASSNPDYKVGDAVQGMFGVQSIYTGPATYANHVDASRAPTEWYLGGLGGTGLAAYFGLLRVGALKQGETVLVTAAAGAVGHLVVQIAKLKGAKVIGVAGGPEKCQRVVEMFGANACIDYKNEDVAARVADLCPEGIDVYFDNVGAEMLEIALDNISMRARIVICGAISEYDNLNEIHAPRNYLNLIGKGARMEGLLNMHWVDEFEAAVSELADWSNSGQIKFEHQIETGIERFSEVLQMLFAGKNVGKLLLRV